jgi:hypothetical protein
MRYFNAKHDWLLRELRSAVRCFRSGSFRRLFGRRFPWPVMLVIAVAVLVGLVGRTATAADPVEGPILAHFRFDGDMKNDVSGKAEFVDTKPTFRENALYLDGNYLHVDKYRCSASLDSAEFSVAIRFKAESFQAVGNPPRAIILAVGIEAGRKAGRTVRLLGLKRSVEGNIVVTWSEGVKLDFDYEIKNSVVEKSKWNTIACTVNLRTYKVVVYLNGALASRFDLPNPNPQQTSSLNTSAISCRFADVVLKGNKSFNTRGAFGGLVDELVVYGRALADADLARVLQPANADASSGAQGLASKGPQLPARTTATTADPLQGSVVAHFRFDGDAKNDAPGQAAFEPKSPPCRENALYLDGKYLRHNCGCRLPGDFDAAQFSVAVRFKAEAFPAADSPTRATLLTAKREQHLLFALKRSVAGNVVVLLPCGEYEIEGSNVEVGKWNTITCSVDLPAHKLILYLNRALVGQIDLPDDLKLQEVRADKLSNAIWTFVDDANKDAFHGLVDELIIYRRALSSAELLHVFEPINLASATLARRPVPRFALTSATGDEMDERLPIPSETEEAKAKNMAREMLRVRFTSAWAAKDNRALASALLEQFNQEKKDSASSYGMLRESADLAVEAGDLPVLTRAVEALSSHFMIDRSELMADSLEKAFQKSHSAERARELTEAALAGMEDAVASDNLPAATRLKALALSAAHKSADELLERQTVERGKRFTAELKQVDKVRSAAKTLREKPDDPEQNLVLGTYLCFTRGAWQPGWNCLAKSNETVLKDLATKSLADPTLPNARAKLGNDWWQASEKAKNPAREEFRAGAGYWYSQALPGVRGTVKTTLEMRLNEIGGLMGEGNLLWNPAMRSNPDAGTSPTSIDAGEREAATWALSHGGYVYMRGSSAKVESITALPAENFSIVSMYIPSTIIGRNDLARLKHSRLLVMLTLESCTIAKGGLAPLGNLRRLTRINVLYSTVSKTDLKWLHRIPEQFITTTTLRDD